MLSPNPLPTVLQYIDQLQTHTHTCMQSHRMLFHVIVHTVVTSEYSNSNAHNSNLSVCPAPRPDFSLQYYLQYTHQLQSHTDMQTFSFSSHWPIDIHGGVCWHLPLPENLKNASYNLSHHQRVFTRGRMNNHSTSQQSSYNSYKHSNSTLHYNIQQSQYNTIQFKFSLSYKQ
jgi:hypothetical protein